jgi:hypothetical protein
MIWDETYKADAAMANKYVAVKLSTTEGKVSLADSGDKSIGILQNVAAADGDSVRVRLIGPTYLKANAAFNAGAHLSPVAATGKLGAAVDGTDYPIVISEIAATAQDDEVRGVVNFGLATTKDLT